MINLPTTLPASTQSRKTHAFLRNVAIGTAAALMLSPLFAQSDASQSSAARQAGITNSERPKDAKTEITCQEEATFDNEKNLATFVGKVVVKDPQFTLFCDKLLVLLNPERKGLERATAIGNVIILQENKDDKGNPTKSTGRAGQAVFEPATGDITLTESPQIQQGINNHISIDPTTVMVLNREGRLNTKGGSRTVIVDASENP